MYILLIAICFLLAMLLSRIMLPIIMLVSYKKRLFDPVDTRKLHRYIIPRLGGIAFMPIQSLLFVVALVIIIKVVPFDLAVQSWALIPHFMLLICGLGVLFMVGLVDDLIGVRYQWKFIAQLSVACFFPISGLWINDLYGIGFFVALPSWVGMPLTVFIVMLIINAINLIDGLDGLCSGIVGIGCLILGGLYVYYQAWWHALFAFITLGTLIPFFYFNVIGATGRKRRIFMGDTGSMTLGYTMAFLAISFATHNTAIKPFSEGAVVVAFSTLMIPVLDVARVMFIRWRAGEAIFTPDQNHLHHQFLRMGMSHRKAMLALLAYVLFFCIFNIIMVQLISNNIVLLCDIVLWGGSHYVFAKQEAYSLKKRVHVRLKREREHSFPKSFEMKHAASHK